MCCRCCNWIPEEERQREGAGRGRGGEWGGSREGGGGKTLSSSSSSSPSHMQEAWNKNSSGNLQIRWARRTILHPPSPSPYPPSLKYNLGFALPSTKYALSPTPPYAPAQNKFRRKYVTPVTPTSPQTASLGEHVTLPCRVENKQGNLQWTRWTNCGLKSIKIIQGGWCCFNYAVLSAPLVVWQFAVC